MAKILKGEIEELEKYVFHCVGADDAKGFKEATKKVFNYIEKNIEFGDYVVCSMEDRVLNNPNKPIPPMKPSPHQILNQLIVHQCLKKELMR